jgi:membrane-associated phospholipid phosphatase
LLTALSSRAAAEEWNGPSYELDPRIDVPMILVPGVLAVGWVLHDQLEPAHCAPLCNETDKSNINAFDRPAAGNYDTNWRRVSDVGVATVLVGGTVAVLAEEGFADGLNDLVVVVESVLWTNGLAVVGNLAARRPRPYLYSEEAPVEERQDPTSGLSFISGHAGLAAAMTTSVFSTLRRRDPEGTLQWVVLGTGTAATGLVGVSRVLAGDHFPTDVLLGAALGGSMGFLIPALHEAPLSLIAAPIDDGAQFAATMAW